MLTEEVARRIEVEIRSQTEILVGDRVASFDGYKKVVGRIEGLRRAIDILNEVQKIYEGS
jgi:hypothetical protein